ncbi:MAG: large conductance mechanosensitive channel protein MscL [Phascolarctobacterium faecium]
MSFFEEFKKFAMRGNVIDLAVGVVIGGAFGKITSSLVDNIIMPPLSLLFGKVDFSGLFISLNGQHYDTLKAAQDAHAPILAYGFINTMLISRSLLAIFVLIKQINRLTPPPLRLQNRVYAFCKTAIADDATRCPHCTSQL